MSFVGTDAFKNIGLNAMVAGTTPPSAAGYLSLHTGAPGTNGANEMTGGSPAYARKAATWASAASGSVALSGSVTFDVPASTVQYVGLWSASGGGTFKGYWPVTNVTFTGQGTYLLSAASLTMTTI